MEKRSVNIELWESTAVFLCAYFYGGSKCFPGMSVLSRAHKESQKVAAGNFRRVYAKLSLSEKQEVRAQISEFENKPSELIEGMIGELLDIKDILENGE